MLPRQKLKVEGQREKDEQKLQIRETLGVAKADVDICLTHSVGGTVGVAKLLYIYKRERCKKLFGNSGQRLPLWIRGNVNKVLTQKVKNLN